MNVRFAHPDAGAVPVPSGWLKQAASPLGEQVDADNFWDADQALASML